MALGVAWGVARTGLSVASDQIAIVSRNVANAQNPDSTRKYAEVTTRGNGGALIADIGRVTNRPMLEAYLNSSSDAETQRAIVAGADALSAVIGDPALGTSPAALLANLESTLRTFAARPSDTTVGRSVLAAADAMADTLNSGAESIAKIRNDADRAIGGAVATVNRLLADLERSNAQVLKLTGSGNDATDELDKRDAILKNLSAEIGIRVIPRSSNDVLVYSDSGIVLFETVARTVSFHESNPLAPGAAGGQVYIDGMQATGPGAVMPISSGRIKGLVEVRDNIAPVFANQLDEIARGLVEAFADRDRSGAGGPDLPGLFTWSGGTVPPTGVLSQGLASSIVVNPGVDPARGGDLRYLRDGGASAPTNPNYRANVTGAAGYSARLEELVSGLSAPRGFAFEAGLSTSASLLDFASGSAGWIEETRKVSGQSLESSDALRVRSSEILSGATGVNIDREMADMLQLERAYQASSRLLSTVDQMFESLFSSTR